MIHKRSTAVYITNYYPTTYIDDTPDLYHPSVIIPIKYFEILKAERLASHVREKKGEEDGAVLRESLMPGYRTSLSAS